MKTLATFLILASLVLTSATAHAWANKESIAAMLRDRDYTCDYCEYVTERGRDHEGVRTFLAGCGGQKNILKYEIKFIPGRDIEVSPVF